MSKEVDILIAALMDAKERIRQMMWAMLILFVPAVIVGSIPWVVVLLLK